MKLIIDIPEEVKHKVYAYGLSLSPSDKEQLIKAIMNGIPLEQEPKTEQFAEWVAREIFDDMWEYNKDAFAEIACRKLAKLGIVRAKCNEWELVEQQESEDRNERHNDRYIH